ncbi:MAG: YbhB/YbcL family Raf kinase inhibitor-like protein [Alphaproteobacteria bacterium]
MPISRRRVLRTMLGPLVIAALDPLGRVTWAEESGMTMTVSSTAFTEGNSIPKRFTCDGENVSPALAWSGTPQKARSLALVCDDPDAPNGTWYHWGAFDIPPATAQLAEAFAANAQVGAIRQAVNDFGKFGYGGPCPPRGRGAHHYRFRIMALDVERLDLGAEPPCRKILDAAKDHTIAWGRLVGTYAH